MRAASTPNPIIDVQIHMPSEIAVMPIDAEQGVGPHADLLHSARVLRLRLCSIMFLGKLVWPVNL